MAFSKVARAGVRARNGFLKANGTRLTYMLCLFGAVGSGPKTTPKLEVAILCVGAIQKRPMVVTDADGCDTIAIRVMSYFGITYDHRLVEGADADHFLNDFKKTLEADAWPELEPYC